jgi:hypothetical protein
VFLSLATTVFHIHLISSSTESNKEAQMLNAPNQNLVIPIVRGLGARCETTSELPSSVQQQTVAKQ